MRPIGKQPSDRAKELIAKVGASFLGTSALLVSLILVKNLTTIAADRQRSAIYDILNADTFLRVMILVAVIFLARLGLESMKFAVDRNAGKTACHRDEPSSARSREPSET